VLRPKHFLLKKVSWLVRSWAPPQDVEAEAGSWYVHDEKFDTAGGVGLEHDLERFCTTLEWARGLTKPQKAGNRDSNRDSASSSGGHAAARSDDSLDDPLSASLKRLQLLDSETMEERQKQAQCAVALGHSITSCISSMAQLKEKHAQGHLQSGLADAEKVRMGLLTAHAMLSNLVEGGSVTEVRDAAKASIADVRKIAKRLSPWSWDPENDVTAVLCVAVSIAAGVVLALEWDQLTGSNARHIVDSWGWPEWMSQWLWFGLLFGVMIVVLGCSVVCPLTVASLRRDAGKEVPLRKKQ